MPPYLPGGFVDGAVLDIRLQVVSQCVEKTDYAVQGSTTSIPQPSKSATFRVATAAPCARAMAAI